MIGVLFSGGLESVVLAHMAAATGQLEGLYMCDYGQAPLNMQENILRDTAKKLSCNFYVDFLPYAKWAMGTDTFKHPGFNVGAPGNDYNREDTEEYYAGVPYLNGRNALMIFQAAIHASYKGCNRLWMGFQTNDDEIEMEMAPHPRPLDDTTDHTVQMVNGLIRASFKDPFHVHCPLLAMNKAGVVNTARSMGIDISKETYSCEFYPRCGVCDQCKDRERAGLDD